MKYSVFRIKRRNVMDMKIKLNNFNPKISNVKNYIFLNMILKQSVSSALCEVIRIGLGKI